MNLEFLELLCIFKNEMNSHFDYIKNFSNTFQCIGNPQVATTKEISEMNILNCNIGLLKK